jgi:hypothetical protein
MTLLMLCVKAKAIFAPERSEAIIHEWDLPPHLSLFSLSAADTFNNQWLRAFHLPSYLP